MTINNTGTTTETQTAEDQSAEQTENAQGTGAASTEAQGNAGESAQDNSASSDDPFASRTRESLVDEVKTLRAENKARREAIKATEDSTEDVVRALREEITQMKSEVRREKIAALGVPAEKLDLLMKVEDEETAISLAEALAETKAPRNTDLNAQKGFSNSSTGLTREEQMRQEFLEALSKAQ